MSKITFIVAEPVFLVRKGLVNLINELPKAMVVREVTGLSSLVELVASSGANVVVVSASLVKQTDHLFIKKLKARAKRLQLVCVAQSIDEVPEEIKSQFTQFVLHTDEQSETVEKFRQIIGYAKSDEEASSYSNQGLSEREAQILKDVALGLSNKEIADRNFISPHTVITHRKNITKKLGIKTVSGLTIYAIINKLIGINEVK